MGSCISKCRPKKKFKQDQSTHVQDKLVISQNPPNVNPPIPTSLGLTTMPLEKPLSPAPSTASFSSFSCSKAASSISSSSSLSSLSSCSSSVLSAKDRTFSNEFLWSCVKENPHIVHEKNVLPANKIQYYPNPDPSPLFPTTKSKRVVQEKAVIHAAAPKKRARASSPTLVRQKSFRREQNSIITSTPQRGLRSPSPSRRFGGESNRSFSTAALRSPSPSRRFGGESNRSFSTTYEQSYKRPVVNAVGSGLRRESFRASPSRDPTSNRSVSVRRKEGVSEDISRKMDGDGGIKSGMEMDVVMEDIDNPLIALDCFIFL